MAKPKKDWGVQWFEGIEAKEKKGFSSRESATAWAVEKLHGTTSPHACVFNPEVTYHLTVGRR